MFAFIDWLSAFSWYLRIMLRYTTLLQQSWKNALTFRQPLPLSRNALPHKNDNALRMYDKYARCDNINMKSTKYVKMLAINAHNTINAFTVHARTSCYYVTAFLLTRDVFHKIISSGLDDEWYTKSGHDDCWRVPQHFDRVWCYYASRPTSREMISMRQYRCWNTVSRARHAIIPRHAWKE